MNQNTWLGSSEYFKPELQKSLSSCHKELDRHILRIDISLQEYCKKPWIHLLKGKIGGYDFKLFLPQLEYIKELCFPSLRTCICTAAWITDSLQGHAIMHVLFFGLQARFADFSRMSFFIANPWIIIAVPEKIEAITSGNSISAWDSPHF